ncbi:MAG: hypothetical protein AB4911_17145 [Oscillochloridaceae bacterium umkhey_bin13]
MVAAHPDLHQGMVEESGCVLDRHGRSTGWWVSDDGITLVSIHNRPVGGITRDGRVTDRRGYMLGQLTRYDLESTLLARELGVLAH